MQEVNFKNKGSNEVETYVAKVSEKLKEQVFGVLNHIELAKKADQRLIVALSEI